MAEKKEKITAQPSDGAKQEPAAKPKATVKPATTAKPAATAKPVTTAKPATAAKPAATTAKPTTAAKPAAKPAETAKPAPASKPAAAKPAATKATATKPAATAKPAAETKPAPEPAAKVKAAKQKVSDDKPAKAASSGQGGALTALLHNKKYLIMAAVAFVLVVAIIIGIIAGAKSCGKSEKHFTYDDPVISDEESDAVFSDRPESKDMQVLSPVSASDPAVADIIADAYRYEYPATTEVGFYGKVLGEVGAVKPVEEIKDERDMFPLTGIDIPEGEPRYPKFGYSMNSVLGDTAEAKAARDALIAESDYVTAYGTRNNSGNGENGEGTYNKMDENGYLYFVNSEGTRDATNPDGSHRRLYKHTAADGLWYEGLTDRNGNVVVKVLSDDEPRLEKQVTIRPRKYGSYSVTGLYAPAGEVIKIQISEEDMNATGGITIHIGQALYNGQSNNIWTAKGQMQRFPNILNTMTINKSTATLENGVYTGYVGSFVGGPLYIRNTLATFTATISGGVNYPHLILGYTTKEEYEESKKSTAPYFDLEVWNYGVLHSGPRYYAERFSYEELYKAAVLWEKISSVTTSGSSQGIVFLYEPFVAAGAAVAFPGRSSVNCPAGWMAGSLDYNSLVSSGSWGNLHEYHHNFQGYGVGNGGEVTNNGMTLVSYALFTKISSKRGIGSYGGQGLGGWNNYTSATWALNDLLSIRNGGHPSNGDQGLAIYATLLHNYGANNYIQAKLAQQSGGYGQSYAGYFRAWEQITHNDMTYYFRDVLKGLSSGDASKWHNSEYTSMFVPVSCVYQTGRSYLYNGEKKYFQTMQPYVIPYGSEFNIDLSRYDAPGGQYKSGSIVIPDNFSYGIKSVSKPKSGNIQIVDGYNLKYTPGAAERSGQIVVTLEINEKNGKFKVDDVDLVLEFEQSHETNKMTLERTIYSYTEETYTDAQTAYESNFAGYADKKLVEHTNPVQNCNTDIWLYPDTPESHKEHPTSPDHHFVRTNDIDVVDGKLYFEEEGTYRIYLRGRGSCAVYYSLDGKEYKYGAKVTGGSGAGFYTNDESTYFNVTFKEPHSWLYVREVFIVKAGSYIGLGYGKWTQPMFTMAEQYFKADGKTTVESTDDPEYAYTRVSYNDYAGNEVAYSRKDKGSDETLYFKKQGGTFVASTVEEVSALTKSEPIPPTSASYINAYRSNYEFPDNTSFESEYFYLRSYNCDYVGEPEVYTSKYPQTYMESISNYVPWDSTFAIGNLFDGDTSTNVHTERNFLLSEQKPLIIAFDMGQVVKANSLTMSVYSGNLGWRAFPKVLSLEGSLDGENWFEMGKWSSLNADAHSGKALAFHDKEFRYYKITVTKSNYDATERFALSELSLSYTMRLNGNGSNVIAPTNENIIFSKNWESRVAVSTFGRINVGGSGDKAVFEFKGTRLAILTCDAYGKNFDVYIDGKKVDSIDIVPHTGDYGITYLSEKLESGTHRVEILCTGEANIDSIAIFNEAE